MLIIPQSPSQNGSYPPIQPWPGLTPPDGYDVWPEELDTADFYAYNGFVILTVVRGTVSSYQPNAEAWEAWQGQVLASRKEERIADSKQQLSAYLLAHPLQWTDGQSYAITTDKQQQLTSKIMSATLAAQTGQPYTLTWNATGEVCQPWTLENLTALAFAIDARVTALVTYQQTQEVAMREAATVAALEAIVVDYDSVPLAGGETA